MTTTPETVPAPMALRTKLLAQAKSKQSLRTTIPWQVRDELGLKDGDSVEWGVTTFTDGGKAAWVRLVVVVRQRKGKKVET